MARFNTVKVKCMNNFIIIINFYYKTPTRYVCKKNFIPTCFVPVCERFWPPSKVLKYSSIYCKVSCRTPMNCKLVGSSWKKIAKFVRLTTKFGFDLRMRFHAPSSHDGGFCRGSDISLRYYERSATLACLLVNSGRASSNGCTNSACHSSAVYACSLAAWASAFLIRSDISRFS